MVTGKPPADSANPSLTTRIPPRLLHHGAHPLHRGAHIFGRHTQPLRPVTNLVVRVEAKARAVSMDAILRVLWHALLNTRALYALDG